MEWEIVITNAGGGYFPETAEFICPQNGIYFFSINSVGRSEDPKRVDLQLMHNNNLIVATLADTDGALGASTNSAAIHCTNGDKVWVKCNVNPCIMRGTLSHLTNFSGFRIVGE